MRQTLEALPERQLSRAEELEERLINFAVRIVKLSANLPRTPAGKHIAGQILWLRVIKRSRVLRAELLKEIIEENSELCRIFTASLKPARERTK